MRLLTAPYKLVVVGLFTLGVSGISGVSWAEDSCTLVKEEPIGMVIPVRLTCLTDLDSERLYAVVSDPLQQAKAFSSLGDRTRILSDEGDHLRVQQFHENRMISDREVIVEWRLSGGPQRRIVAWRSAEDQSGVTEENVRPEVHEGHWEISPQDEGCKVVYYVKYLPGGHIPDQMVKSFVGRGVRKVVAELFEYLRASPVPPKKATQ